MSAAANAVVSAIESDRLDKNLQLRLQISEFYKVNLDTAIKERKEQDGNTRQ